MASDRQQWLTDLTRQSTAPAKLPGIRSEGVGAGSRVATTIDAIPQLAAISEGSGDAKGRQGARAPVSQCCRTVQLSSAQSLACGPCPLAGTYGAPLGLLLGGRFESR